MTGQEQKLGSSEQTEQGKVKGEESMAPAGYLSLPSFLVSPHYCDLELLFKLWFLSFILFYISRPHAAKLLQYLPK